MTSAGAAARPGTKHRAPDAGTDRDPPLAGHDLRTRLLASLVLIPLFLVALAWGGVVFLGTVLLLTAIATWEFLGLAARRGVPVWRPAGVSLALGFPAVLYASPASGGTLLLALLVLGVVGVGLVHLLARGRDQAISAVSETVFAALYTGLLFAHFVLVREIPAQLAGAPYRVGAVLLAVPIALTWVNDTAAYAIGRRWGRRRLMPQVSPGKSVEGALGALAVTVVVAVPLVDLADRWVGIFALADALVLGLLVGLFAPCGDLVESAFKRDAGVKDVSRLIPGHGGVLDRFDSLLFVVPLFYWYLKGVVL